MHRKPLAALAAALSVLVLAGFAFAHGGGGPSSVQAASATFRATTVSDLKTDTCNGAAGYTRTRATYTGTATSTDARLNGPLTVRATTVYNSDSKLGVVVGGFRVGTTRGFFQAVDSDGSLAGFANGMTHKPHSGLLANLSATFDPATGFDSGSLGDGSSTDTAVFVSGRCPGHHEHEGETGPSGPSGPTGVAGTQSKAGKHGRHHKHGRRH